MNLKEAIQAAVVGLIKIQTYVATVKSVNWSARTASVQLPDGRVWTARLRSVADGVATGLTLRPKVDSKVLVSIINNQEGNCWISQYSEVDEVVLIDDSNGGLVIVQDNVDRLNLIENSLNELKQLLAGWTPVSSDGGAALKTAVTSWAALQLTKTVVSDIENTKVKH